MPSAEFEQAAKEVNEFLKKPTDDELLQLYGLFKQVQQTPKFEDAEKPGTFDFKGKAKYRAWEKVVNEGVTPEEAEKKYIEFVAELKPKYT